MADGITIDTSELRQLAVDFSAVPDELARHARPVVSKGAHNIKEEWRAEFAQSTHFKGGAKSVSYDLEDDGFSAEIGPERGGGGSIAGIAHFGGAPWSGRKNPGRGWQQGPGGGGTLRDPQEFLDNEEPKFARALSELAAELLR